MLRPRSGERLSSFTLYFLRLKPQTLQTLHSFLGVHSSFGDDVRETLAFMFGVAREHP